MSAIWKESNRKKRWSCVRDVCYTLAHSGAMDSCIGNCDMDLVRYVSNVLCNRGYRYNDNVIVDLASWYLYTHGTPIVDGRRSKATCAPGANYRQLRLW